MIAIVSWLLSFETIPASHCCLGPQLVIDPSYLRVSVWMQACVRACLPLTAGVLCHVTINVTDINITSHCLTCYILDDNMLYIMRLHASARCPSLDASCCSC